MNSTRLSSTQAFNYQSPPSTFARPIVIYQTNQRSGSHPTPAAMFPWGSPHFLAVTTVAGSASALCAVPMLVSNEGVAIHRGSGQKMFAWSTLDVANSTAAAELRDPSDPEIPLPSRAEMEASRGLLELNSPRKTKSVEQLKSLMSTNVPDMQHGRRPFSPVICKPLAVPTPSNYGAIPAIDLSTVDMRQQARDLLSISRPARNVPDSVSSASSDDTYIQEIKRNDIAEFLPTIAEEGVMQQACSVYGADEPWTEVVHKNKRNIRGARKSNRYTDATA